MAETTTLPPMVESALHRALARTLQPDQLAALSVEDRAALAEAYRAAKKEHDREKAAQQAKDAARREKLEALEAQRRAPRPMEVQTLRCTFVRVKETKTTWRFLEEAQGGGVPLAVRDLYIKKEALPAGRRPPVRVSAVLQVHYDRPAPEGP